MFGKQWEPAQGTIVAKQVIQVAGYSSTRAAGHEYVVDVRTSDGEVFRARVPELRTSDWWDPKIGASVRVERDRKSGAVRFDKTDPAISFKAYQAGQSSSFDSALAAEPGSASAASQPASAPNFAAAPGMGTIQLSPEQLNAMVTAAMAQAQVVRAQQVPPTS